MGGDAVDRARGALVGLACGDAVGTTLEFKPPGSFEPITDMVGGGPFRLQPGEWTDDTSTACAWRSRCSTGEISTSKISCAATSCGTTPDISLPTDAASTSHHDPHPARPVPPDRRSRRP